MRKIHPLSSLIVLFLHLFVFNGLCQPRKSSADSLKVRMALANFEEWMSKDPKKAKKYLDEARSHIGNDAFLTGITAFFEGKYEHLVQKNNDGRQYLKAYELLRPIHTKEAYSFAFKALYNRAVQFQVSDSKRCLEFAIQAVPLAEKSGDSVLISSANLSIGLIFRNIGDYEKSLPYLAAANRYTKKKDYQRLIISYIRWAASYNHLNKAKEAKPLLEKAKALLPFLPENSIEEVSYYEGEGTYFGRTGEYKQAMASYDKGIAIAKRSGYKYEELGLLKLKSISLVKLKDYPKAVEIMLYLAKQKEFVSAPDNKKHLYHDLSETYMGMNNMSAAFEWQRKYSLLNDSIHDSRLKNEINALEIKYRNVENKKQIATLQFANSEAELNAKNNRLLSWLLGSISVSLLTIGTFSFIQFRNNKKLDAQKELNYQQKIKEMTQQQELALMKAILQGEEKERNRVARDLHDGLGGLLAGVKLNLSAIAAGENFEIHQHLHGVIKQLDGSVSELRRISHNLMPETLTKFGLDAAIKELVGVLSKKDIVIDYQSFEINKHIAPQVQTHIYRIVQELVANAVRHSQASHIVLQCSQNGSIFLITIEDNGIGFDPETLTEGMGLKNIKNRIEYLKGNFDIRTAKNKGTTINIELNVT